MNKNEFASNIVEALKEVHTLPNSNNLYDLDALRDPIDIQEKYIDSVALSKVERLYSTVLNAAKNRVSNATSEDMEVYREEKLAILNEKINRYMLGFEMLSSEEEKELVNKKVDELILEHDKLKDANIEDLRKALLDKFNTSKDFNEKDEVFENISDKSVSNFFKLLKEYKALELELKSIEMEKTSISIGLSRTLYNFKVPGMDEKEMFTDNGLRELKEAASSYIQHAVDEEIIEKENFSEIAKNSYNNLIDTNYKNSDTIPYDSEALIYYKSKIDPILFERANSQLVEWNRIHNKLFKSKEDNHRLENLIREIDVTKKSVGISIRQFYRNHYSSNPAYMPIASKLNGKFIYAVGSKALYNFFYVGSWPTEEELNNLRITRELNKKEAEDYVIKVEFAKDKFSYLSDSSINAKKERLQTLKENIISLVGDKEKVVNSGIFEENLEESKTK